MISVGDLGIRRAIQIAYEMDDLPGPEDIDRIAEPGDPTGPSPVSICGDL